MIDYTKSKIYLISCGTNYFIGGTIMSISHRICSYRFKFNCGTLKNEKLCEIFQNGKFKIAILEYYNCENKYCLNKRVRYHRREYRKSLNKKIDDTSLYFSFTDEI